MTGLQAFLRSKRIPKADTTTKPTHTGTGDKITKYYRYTGSYTISPDDHDTFYKLIQEDIEKGYDVNIVECPLDPGFITVDFDFKQATPDRLFNDDHLKLICKKLDESIRNIVDNADVLTYYVSVRPEPYLNPISETEADKYKDGIHIISRCLVPRNVQSIIGDDFIKRLSESPDLDFKDMGYTNEIGKIVDKTCMGDGSGNWFIYGCTKPGTKPYKLCCLYQTTDAEISECFIDNFNDLMLMQLLSIRTVETQFEDDYLPFLQLKKEHLHLLKTKKTNNKPKKEQLRIKKKEDSVLRINNNIDDCRKLVDLLSVERSVKEDLWVKVCWALCNEGNDDDTFNLWDDFSKKCPAKYDESVVLEKWNTAKWKYIEGQGLRLGSLHKWAKEDNPEGYASTIFSNSIVLWANNDKEASKVVLDHYGCDSFAVCNSTVYYYDKVAHIHKIGDEKMLMLLCSDADIKHRKIIKDKDGNETVVYSDYSANTIHATAIAKQVLQILKNTRNDDMYVKKCNDKMRGYIPYRNGLVDTNGRIYNYSEKPDIKPFIQVPYDLPLNLDSVSADTCKKYTMQYFETLDDKKYEFIKMLSRCVFGYGSLDKTYCFLLGVRNSGKGVIQSVLNRAFAGIIGTTSLPIIKGRSCDVASMNRTLISQHHYIKRLVFSNEMEQLRSDKPPVIDGQYLKQVVASGGDRISARTMYKDEVEIYNNSFSVFCLNELPKIEPINSIETSILFTCNKVYDDKGKDIKEIIDEDEMLPMIILKIMIDNFTTTKIRDLDFDRDSIEFNKGSAMNKTDDVIKEYFVKVDDNIHTTYRENSKIKLWLNDPSDKIGVRDLKRAKISDAILTVICAMCKIDKTLVDSRLRKLGYGFSSKPSSTSYRYYSNLILRGKPTIEILKALQDEKSLQHWLFYIDEDEQSKEIQLALEKKYDTDYECALKDHSLSIPANKELSWELIAEWICEETKADVLEQKSI